MKFRRISLLAVAVCTGLMAFGQGKSGGQSAEMIKDMDTKVEAAADTVAKNDAVVEIETTLGPVTILLYGDTPAHRDNFLKLASEGYYDGVLFHRVIKNFMVQTGDPDSRDAKPGASLGAGDPGYTLPAEFRYPKHYHKYGAVAAARTGDMVNPEKRSSGSQFYIVTGEKVSPQQLDVMEQRMSNGPRQAYWRNLMKEHSAEIKALQQSGDRESLEALRQQLIRQTEEAVPEMKLPEQLRQDYTTLGGTPHLDNDYTVFGEVISGMDTVEKIQNSATGANDRPVEDIKILSTKVIKQ